MNRLKQHLNDSLQELELTPAMEAEILMNVEKPVRKVRFHSRAIVVALLVVCMVSITAVAAAFPPAGNSLPIQITSVWYMQSPMSLQPARLTLPVNARFLPS